MTIAFKSIGSTPLPKALLASIILDSIVGRTMDELVALGYGKLTVDDIAYLGWICGRSLRLGKEEIR